MSSSGVFSQSKLVPFPVVPVLTSPRATKIRSLRVSVTDRCNFRCRYCMPACGVKWMSHTELLPLEQLFEQVQWVAERTAIERVRLTGGEPLVRKGIHRLITRLSSLPHLREISLTTNGALLADEAWALKAAGLTRVNISLDSLNPQRFAELTRGGRLNRTLAGITAALHAGLKPVKLNAVLQRSTWQEDVPQLLDFAADLGVELRFIELMRTGTEREWCASEVVTVDTVQAWLSERAGIHAATTRTGSPAVSTTVQWGGRNVTVGWISPRSHPFCASCERLRMDARGRLHRCLMDDATLDLPALQAAGDQHATEAFLEYLAGKHAPNGMEMEYAMSQIGG